MSTFGTVVDNVAARIGDPGHAEFETEIKQAVIDAIDHYESERFWFLEDYPVATAEITSATVASTEFYAWPTSPQLVVLDTLRIKTTGAVPYTLTRRTWAEIDELATPASFNTGAPYDYAVRGEFVRLHPIPDAVYTLYWTGIVEPTALTTASADGDTNVWMTQARRLIEEHAAMLMAENPLRNTALQADCAKAAARELKRLRVETRRKLATGRNTPHGALG